MEKKVCKVDWKDMHDLLGFAMYGVGLLLDGEEAEKMTDIILLIDDVVMTGSCSPDVEISC